MATVRGAIFKTPRGIYSYELINLLYWEKTLQKRINVASCTLSSNLWFCSFCSSITEWHSKKTLARHLHLVAEFPTSIPVST